MCTLPKGYILKKQRILFMNLDQLIPTSQHIDPTTGFICVFLGALGLVISNQASLESKMRVLKATLDTSMQSLAELKRKISQVSSSLNNCHQVVENCPPVDPNSGQWLAITTEQYQLIYQTFIDGFHKLNDSIWVLHQNIHTFERALQTITHAAEHFSLNILLLPGIVVSTTTFKICSYIMAGFGIVILFTHHKIKDFFGAAAPTPAEMPGLANWSSIDETILSLLALFVFMVVLALIITLVSHVWMHYNFKTIIHQLKQQ